MALEFSTATQQVPSADLERGQGLENSTTNPIFTTRIAANDDENRLKPARVPRWYTKLVEAGVEENGVRPVPPKQREQTQYNNLFTVFFACLLCVLPYVQIFRNSWAESGKSIR